MLKRENFVTGDQVFTYPTVHSREKKTDKHPKIENLKFNHLSLQFIFLQIFVKYSYNPSIDFKVKPF